MFSYTAKSGEKKLQEFDVKNGSTTTVVIPELRKYTFYTFQVLAYTVEDGPLSKQKLGISTAADGNYSFSNRARDWVRVSKIIRIHFDVKQTSQLERVYEI